MSPDDGVRRGVPKQGAAEVTPDAPPQDCRGVGLLGEVAQGAVDPATHEFPAESLPEMIPPGGIGALATHKDHFFEVVTRQPGEVRGRQLDDPADATGSKMTVYDYQLHARQCSTLAGARPIYFCEGAGFFRRLRLTGAGGSASYPPAGRWGLSPAARVRGSGAPEVDVDGRAAIR